MSYDSRVEIYKKIESHRQRPLITYITSGRPGDRSTGVIASDAVREIIDQLALIPPNTKEIDLLINSYGGDGLTSWRIISLIREFLGSDGIITTLVPFYAFSAGTLLCLGSNEIFLHPRACLGPVDPQIEVHNQSGTQKFAYEDLAAYTNFLKEEGGLTEQKEKSSLLGSLVSEIKPSVIGASKRSSMQSKVMAEKLLKLHMSGVDAQKAELIAEKLNKSYFSHGHAVSREEAIILGLKIAGRDETIEELIWSVFTDIEAEMKMREVFDPTMIYLSDPLSAKLLDPPPVISVPGNAPPQIAQQIWQQVLNNLNSNQGPVIEFDLLNAVIESKQLSSKFITKGKFFGTRLADLNFLIGRPILEAGWRQSNAISTTE